MTYNEVEELAYHAAGGAEAFVYITELLSEGDPDEIDKHITTCPPDFNELRKLFERYKKHDLAKRRNLIKVAQKIEDCKGYIYGFNKRILSIPEIKIEIDEEYDFEDSVHSSVKAYSPNDLNDYLQFIKPLGKFEKDYAHLIADRLKE